MNRVQKRHPGAEEDQPMSSVLGMITVLFLLLGIYSLIFGRRLFHGDASGRTEFGFRQRPRGSLWLGALEGLVLLFALATISGRGFDLLNAILVGALVALFAALGSLVSGPGRFLIQTAYSVVGLLAAAKLLMALYETGAPCTQIDPTLRTGVVVALVVVWALSLCAGIFSARLAWLTLAKYVGRWNASSGLALFGALDVIVLAAGPIGLGIGDAGVNVIFWGVAVIGLLTGIAPELVMLASGLALGVISVASTYTSIPFDCGGAGSYVPMAMILGYVASAALISRVTLGVARRRI